MTKTTKELIAFMPAYLLRIPTTIFAMLCLCLMMACQSTSTRSKYDGLRPNVNDRQRQHPAGTYLVDDDANMSLAMQPEIDTRQASKEIDLESSGLTQSVASLKKEAKHFFMLVNAARNNPSKTLAGCDVCLEKACYSPVQQLTWDDELARVAHFHALHLVETSCFEHRSSCELKENLGFCDGHPSCACVNPKKTSCNLGTKSFERIKRVSPSTHYTTAGENLAAITGGMLSGKEMMNILYWEEAANRSCDLNKNNGNGHRANILDKDFTRMGAAIYCATSPKGRLSCVGVQVLSN